MVYSKERMLKSRYEFKRKRDDERCKSSKRENERNFLKAAFEANALNNNSRKKLMCPIEIIRPQKAPSDIFLSKKVINHHDRTNLALRLFQYQGCPHCGKVRAFLDYYGFAYEIVEVNPVTKSQLKVLKEYNKVPILSSNDGVLFDSTLIITKLASFLRNRDAELSEIEQAYPMIEALNEKNEFVKCYPHKYVVFVDYIQSSEQIAADREEREWREWVDGKFITLILPNVCRTLKESVETFKWFSDVGEWNRVFTNTGRLLATYAGAFTKWLTAKCLKRRRHIDDERELLICALNEWTESLGPARQYMGGSQPNLADLGMYGAMSSFHGCAVFREVVVEGSPIECWYSRMKKVVETHQGRRMLERRSSLLYRCMNSE